LAPLGPDNDTLEGVTLKHITMQNPKRTLFTTLNHFCPTILSILLYIKWECRKILNLRVKNWVRKIVYFARLAMMAIQKRGIT
jgi:hypothetical protein